MLSSSPSTFDESLIHIAELTPTRINEFKHISLYVFSRLIRAKKRISEITFILL